MYVCGCVRACVRTYVGMRLFVSVYLCGYRKFYGNLAYFVNFRQNAKCFLGVHISHNEGKGKIWIIVQRLPIRDTVRFFMPFDIILESTV